MNDPIGKLEAVATNAMFMDPAIDMSDPAGDGPDGAPLPSGEERLVRYRAERDMGCLVLKPDVAPTVFVLSPIPQVAAPMLLEGMSTAVRYVSAFQLSVHEIRLPDGTTMRPKNISPVSYGARKADDDWINRVMAKWGADTVYELGRLAFERARLPVGAHGPFSWPGM